MPDDWMCSSTTPAIVELQLMRNMALELAKYGVRVNALSPGAIETKMTSGIMGNPGLYGRVLSGIPMKRFGTPDEIAGLLLFLASDWAGYITGLREYMFADMDGVLVIPREIVLKVLEKAEKEFRHEKDARELYRQPGVSPLEVYKKLGKLQQ